MLNINNKVLCCDVTVAPETVFKLTEILRSNQRHQGGH